MELLLGKIVGSVMNSVPVRVDVFHLITLLLQTNAEQEGLCKATKKHSCITKERYSYRLELAVSEYWALFTSSPLHPFGTSYYHHQGAHVRTTLFQFQPYYFRSSSNKLQDVEACLPIDAP